MGYVRKKFAKLIITYQHSIIAVGMQLFVRLSMAIKMAIFE